MSSVGEREIRTQQRGIAFFTDALGYAYLGHWQDREGNRNVERDLLSNWLKRQGYSDKIIGRVLHELNRAAGLGGGKTLYDSNREVYGLLRDGVVLDLRYEARDIDQNITSQAKIDQWFELKTRGLTDVAKAQLKQRWGTLQKVLSTRDG